MHFAFVEQQLVNPDASARARWLDLVNSGAIIGTAQSEQNDKTVAGRGLETRAERDPDGVGYRLTGVQYYSTGSLYADYIWVFAARRTTAWRGSWCRPTARAWNSSTTGTASASA